MTEYAVRSRRVVLPDGVREAAIVIRGECISSIVPASSLPTGMHVEDAGDDVVMPGLVDCHVHINEPGRTEWEGFATATRAAAAGGVTTVVDMPLNSSPVTTTRSAFEQKLAATEGLLSVDTGFWGGVVPGNAAEILSLGRAGVLGSKCFLVHSGIDEFPNVTESDLREAMPRLRDAGIPLLVHAELDLGAPEPTDPRAYRGYLESRPKAWEDAAIALMLSLCRETGCPIHIVHLSSASAIPMLREARASGLPVTVETCPHYLCLEAEEVPDGATIYKCAPPIRERQNRDALWSALAEGVIDFVISDHSPCAPALKCFETGSFPDAWGGIASLQLVLPSIWTEARRRGFSIDRVAKWLSEAPARFAGLADRKGALEIGRHADIVVFDPEAEFEVDSSRLQFRHKMSPYLGRTLRGEVRSTYLRGKKVVEGSSFLAGRGRALLHRSDSR